MKNEKYNPCNQYDNCYETKTTICITFPETCKKRKQLEGITIGDMVHNLVVAKGKGK